MQMISSQFLEGKYHIDRERFPLIFGQCPKLFIIVHLKVFLSVVILIFF